MSLGGRLAPDLCAASLQGRLLPARGLGGGRHGRQPTRLAFVVDLVDERVRPALDLRAPFRPRLGELLRDAGDLAVSVLVRRLERDAELPGEVRALDREGDCLRGLGVGVDLSPVQRAPHSVVAQHLVRDQAVRVLLRVARRPRRRACGWLGQPRRRKYWTTRSPIWEWSPPGRRSPTLTRQFGSVGSSLG